jgi:DNA-binding NarL/FixJ family response regulator
MGALVAQLGLSTLTAATGAEALMAARDRMPVLVTLEVELEEPSGYEVCRQLRDRFGETLPIVFVTSTRKEPYDEIAALLLGADDYFTRPLREDRFIARIRRLLARAMVPDRRAALTQRERQVLALLVNGRPRAEIAESLSITPKTAATHIEHILAKLGAHSQAQAIAFALKDYAPRAVG